MRTDGLRAASWRVLVVAGVFASGAALWGCADAREGTIGAGATCTATLDDYELATHPAVSSLTGVDTREVPPPVPNLEAGACCADSGAVAGGPGASFPFEPMRTDAAYLPWTGYCWEQGDQSCDRCNSCPYGVSALQGVWVDTAAIPGGCPMHGYPHIANRISVDGNTFRWQSKDRLSGRWVDYRGYYYCAYEVDPDMTLWLDPVVVMVAMSVTRGRGAGCGLRPNHDPTYIDWSEPLAIEGDHGATKGVLSVGFDGLPLLEFVKTKPDFSSSSSEQAIAFEYESERLFCHPGAQTDPSVPNSHPETCRCPEESEFLDCWDAEE